MPENFFTVAGATASNQANSGVVVAVFPATEVSGGSGEGGSGGGGSGGGGSRDSVVTVYYAIAEYAGMQTKLPVTVLDETGNASVRLGSVADVLIENNEDITVSMPSIPEVNSYTIFMDASVLSGPENETHLTFVTDRGSVTVPGGMLYGTGILGEIGIKISDGDKAAFNSDAKAIIGDKPIILLELFADGEPTGWSNTSDPVTVCMPYTPAETELSDLESIIILTADGSGTAVTVPNGRYIPDIGALTFTSNHFGYFAAGYNRMSFNDIAEDAWYCRAVGFIAARGITSGIGGGNFGPDVKLTRGQFIVMLMKSYEIMPDENPRDNFADAGNTYYTGYLAAAKRLGISSGVGNNMFQPDREITRQEMFTLLYNALKAIGIVSQVEGAGELSGFKDADMIAPWAIEAMEYLVKSEIISGSGGELFPASTATRAEMAQVLYNLLSK